MKTRRTFFGLMATGMTAGILLAAQPASAAVVFGGGATWTVGGVIYEIENSSSNAIGGFAYVVTPSFSGYSFYSEYARYFGGGGFSAVNDEGQCLSATATQVTESNGDVVISCEPNQLGSTDVWFTASYRIYADNKLARSMFTLENRGTSAVSGLSDSGNSLDWEMNYSNLQASSNNSSSCSALTASDNWVMTARTSDSTIAGYAWQAKGGQAFDFAGNNCSTGFNQSHFVKESIAPGEKLAYMTFVATAEPASTSNADMTAAFAASVAKMSAFDELNSTLCRGIADGTVIEGWGTCPGSASLPDTGASTALIGSSVAIGSGLLIAGALALVIARRRQART